MLGNVWASSWCICNLLLTTKSTRCECYTNLFIAWMNHRCLYIIRKCSSFMCMLTQAFFFVVQCRTMFIWERSGGASSQEWVCAGGFALHHIRRWLVIRKYVVQSPGVSRRGSQKDGWKVLSACPGPLHRRLHHGAVFAKFGSFTAERRGEDIVNVVC